MARLSHPHGSAGAVQIDHAPHPIIRLLLIGWLILLVGAIWLTGSEGGWLGLAAAGGFWSLIWLAGAAG
jgi:hypothetical protein